MIEPLWGGVLIWQQSAWSLDTLVSVDIGCEGREAQSKGLKELRVKIIPHAFGAR